MRDTGRGDQYFGGNPGEGGSGMLRDESPSGFVTRPAWDESPSGFVTRPAWDEYFMGVAQAISMRGDCRHRQVGCVLVDANHRIIGTGYNGAEPGGPSCLLGQCPRGMASSVRSERGGDDYSNCVAIHAEANALIFARTSCLGATAYVSSDACENCKKLLRASGVHTVVENLGNGVLRWL